MVFNIIKAVKPMAMTNYKGPADYASIISNYMKELSIMQAK